MLVGLAALGGAIRWTGWVRASQESVPMIWLSAFRQLDLALMESWDSTLLVLLFAELHSIHCLRSLSLMEYFRRL